MGVCPCWRREPLRGNKRGDGHADSMIERRAKQTKKPTYMLLFEQPNSKKWRAKHRLSEACGSPTGALCLAHRAKRFGVVRKRASMKKLERLEHFRRGASRYGQEISNTRSGACYAGLLRILGQFSFCGDPNRTITWWFWCKSKHSCSKRTTSGSYTRW